MKKQIYESKYLIINYDEENTFFRQHWKLSPPNYDCLKEEFLAYIKLYEEYKPPYTLWVNHEFQLEIDKEMHAWIDKHINAPCCEFGNQKCALVICKDVLTQISIIDAFDTPNPCANIQYFASEEQAIAWFKYPGMELPDQIRKSIIADSKISFKGVDTKGRTVIEIKDSGTDITNTLELFRNVFEENKFIKAHINQFQSLTKREIDIFIEVAKKNKHQQIADQFSLSLFTVRTHWKNIKRKLQIKTKDEIYKYYKAFILK